MRTVSLESNQVDSVLSAEGGALGRLVRRVWRRDLAVKNQSRTSHWQVARHR